MGRVRHPAGTPPLFALSGKSRARLLPIILLAFALRALIPIGFMPASDGTLSLMLCPGGLPLALLPVEKTMQDGMGMPMPQPHHAAGHKAMDDGFCAFTTGFSPAPPALLLLAVLALLVASLGAALTHLPVPAGIRLVHVPQARAPPATA